MEERPLVRAAPAQSNHHHLEYSADREKARIIREKSGLWEAFGQRGHAASVDLRQA
jgi:hypothetical protein